MAPFNSQIQEGVADHTDIDSGRGAPWKAILIGPSFS